jgi:hypothetical protein
VGLLDLFRPPRLEPLNPPLRRGSLTASARVVTPEQGKAMARKVRARGWQLASFTYRVAIPEVGYVMRFLGNNSTHIRLFAGDRRGDDVVELDDDYGWLAGEGDAPAVYDPDALPPDLVAMARDALDRLTASSPSGGGAAILAPIVQAFEGPGECWLVGRYDPEADVETWAVHSISELTAQDGRYPGTPADGPRGYWRLTTGEGRDAETIDLDPATTTVIRLWTADSQWSSEPDSPMRSLVGTCERLLLIDRANDAALRSRAAGNGFILMPDEMGFGAGPEDDPDAPDETDFQRDMATQLTTPLTQDGSAASVTPGVIYGPYAYLDRIRHLTMERPLDPKLADAEARLLTRLGIGLDVPPEVLTGYADVNHWNVAQVSEDTFKLHQEPVTIKAVEALTLGYMRSVLLDAGWERALVDRVVSWFDPASLIAPRDQRDAANDAFDRGQISGKAYRRLLRLDEADAPEVEAATADAPVGQTGMLATQLGTVLDLAAAAYRAGFRPDSIIERLGLDGWVHTGFRPVTVAEPEVPIIEGGPSIAPEEPAALPPGDTGGEPPAEPPAGISAAASTTGAEPTPAQRRLSRRLMTIDRDLRTKLQAAADAALHRALERAGNRLRAKARSNPDAAAKVDGVPGPLVAAALGRPLVAALDADDTDLLREAFDRLRSQWTEWTTAAAEDAIDAAARITGLDRDDPAVARTVAALRDSFADGAEAAWPALEANLNGLATTLMYEPDPAAEALGELADSLVPPGMIRAALAAVGGLSGAHPGVATAGNPLPGLTSGELLTGFMRDAGAEAVEYEWAYGISSRPFPPHEELDGQVFTDFTDAVLSTAGTGGEWVGDSFVPGDHSGCFIGETLVSGPRARASFTRWYEGPGIEVVTQAGKRFTATPNHPVLTDAGWQPAGALTVGDHLVVQAAGQGSSAVDDDEQQPPAQIEQVAGALPVLDEASGGEVPTAAHDFHGDGAGSHGEVTVVRADRRLLPNQQPAGAQRVSHDELHRAGHAQSPLTSEGHAMRFPIWTLPAPGSLVGGDGERGAVGGTGVGVAEPLRLAVATQRHPETGQMVEDRAAVTPVPARESLRAFAGEVELDKVTIVRAVPLACHVYNLSTDTGWYLADGAVVSNCHCDYATIYADGNTRDEQELIGRTAYQEQKPGKPVPGWDVTVDGTLDTPRTRPAPRR